MNTSPNLGLALLLTTAACSNTTRPGEASSCYAAEGDADEFFVGREAFHAGLTLVDEADALGPPAAFVSCAADMNVQGEFIDDDGVRFWLGVDARLGDTELIPPDILSLVDGASLAIHQTRGFNASDEVTISNGDQPILALQRFAGLQGDIGKLRVDDGGANALPTWDTCGSQTTHTLRFTDDETTLTVENGRTVDLVVGGVAFLATNIFSVEYDWHNCTDGPDPLNQVTWLAVDTSTNAQ